LSNLRSQGPHILSATAGGSGADGIHDQVMVYGEGQAARWFLFREATRPRILKAYDEYRFDRRRRRVLAVTPVDWSDSDLLAALDPYQEQLSHGPYSTITIRSYFDYARRFLNWRTGAYAPRGMPMPSQRPVPSGRRDLPGLISDLDQYEAVLAAARRQPGAIRTYIDNASRFVDWLQGRYVPKASIQDGKVRFAGGRAHSDSPIPGAAIAAGPARRECSVDIELPSDAEVAASRIVYGQAEPRDIAYKVARHLIELNGRDGSGFTRADGVAVLLMSWNAGFYRFRPDLSRTLIADLDQLIARHDDLLTDLGGRGAGTYEPIRDGAAVETIYRDFLTVLWPVGTAKSLHVLAPRFFPIWDGSIAQAFRLQLSPPQRSIDSYLRMMDISSAFARVSGLEDPLKALDEWAYVRFTLKR